MNTSTHHWLVSNSVLTLLSLHNPDLAQRFRSLYREPVDQSIRGQIAAMNHFLGFQFSLLPHPTTDVRAALNCECDFDSWIALMHNVIVPQMLHYQLPVVPQYQPLSELCTI